MPIGEEAEVSDAMEACGHTAIAYKGLLAGGGEILP